MIQFRNLDPMLQQMIIQKGSMPVGDFFFLVPAASATSQYRTWLNSLKVPQSKMFTDLATAYAAMSANRGDVLYVMPGDHAVTAAVTWDKDQTVIQGLGGPNQRQQPSTLTSGGVRIKCVTANIGSVFDITADYFSMFDIGTMNNYADTDNLTDIIVAGRNFYAERCAFRGGNTSTQTTSATSGIPVTIDAGYAARFVNCQIGQSGNATRTAGPGFVYFRGTGGAHGGIDFIGCDFQMRSETNGAAACGFLVAENSLDRITRFLNHCTFYNFSENWGALPDYMFNIDQTTTFDIYIDSTCGMYGFDIVSDNAHVKSIGAAPNSAAVESTAVATS